MKKCILFIVILLSYNNMMAQNKNINDSVRPVIREKIKKFPTTDDYSNFENDPRGRQLAAQVLEKQRVEHSIVVINNKIYKLDAKEYLRLTKDSIAGTPTVIKDVNSYSGINYILIIKTKNNH